MGNRVHPIAVWYRLKQITVNQLKEILFCLFSIFFKKCTLMLEAALIELCTAKLQIFHTQHWCKILGRSFAQALSKTSCLKKISFEFNISSIVFTVSQKHIGNKIMQNSFATLHFVIEKGFTSQSEMKRKALLTDSRVWVFDYAEIRVMSMFVVHWGDV